MKRKLQLARSFQLDREGARGYRLESAMEDTGRRARLVTLRREAKKIWITSSTEFRIEEEWPRARKRLELLIEHVKQRINFAKESHMTRDHTPIQTQPSLKSTCKLIRQSLFPECFQNVSIAHLYEEWFRDLQVSTASSSR
jgi:hypothetical protein